MTVLLDFRHFYSSIMINVMHCIYVENTFIKHNLCMLTGIICSLSFFMWSGLPCYISTTMFNFCCAKNLELPWIINLSVKLTASSINTHLTAIRLTGY